MFLYICQDQESEGAKIYKEVAGDIDDVVFGITSEADVFSEYKISGEAVVLFKNVRSLFFDVCAVCCITYSHELFSFNSEVFFITCAKPSSFS